MLKFEIFFTLLVENTKNLTLKGKTKKIEKNKTLNLREKFQLIFIIIKLF